MISKTALSLSALIASLILLVGGNAFLTTLLGLRLSIEGFSASLIGLILVFYSLGFVGGTLYAGPIIRRVGHIRAFAVFAAVLCTVILIHPLAVETTLWSLLRFVAGFAIAGLMIVVESWFSSKADNRNRASLFAVYQVVFFLSTAGGQILIRVADPSTFIPFTIAAIFVVLALVPLSMTRSESPSVDSGERMSLFRLFRISATGGLGALIAGMLISAFYTMGPVFANRVGLDINATSNFMAWAIITAMVFAWPAGWLCDRFSRYRILLHATAIAGAASLGAALVGGVNMPLLILLVAVFMGVTAALYPIAVAITNDMMQSNQITAASTALLLSYGVGSCIGPLVSALSMELLGPRGLFFSNALILAGLWVFIATRPKQNQPSVSEQEQFVTATPEATLGLQELDPRNTEFTPGDSPRP